LLFLFEDFVLDTDRRELRRNDAVVPVEPQVFDLLAFLIRNRDRVVSKDDLLASVWGGRIVSESTIGTRMNAARAALADSGEAQRLIRTLPRKGFRFVGEVREQQALPSDEPSTQLATAAIAAPVVEAPHRAAIRSRYKWSLVALAAAAAAGVVLVLILWPGGRLPSLRAGPSPKFDPATVPLVDSTARLRLADYAQKPEHKAVAISAVSLGEAVAAPDVESAKAEAMQRCGLRPQTVCMVYAADMEVVWPKEAVPLPAPGDMHTEPLSAFTPAQFASINGGWGQQVEPYSTHGDHRALAVSRTNMWWVTQRPSRDEAIRLAIERCGYLGQIPCLLVSVDGFWTVELPTSRPIINVFLPGTEAEVPAEQRQRVATIYQGKPWRALARGRNGSWHAVTGAASEAAAVDAALQSCAGADAECRLVAIGNFRVAEDR
jgi:DNA-binding winged helix-turn-helix (wHTH) protein